MEPVKIIPAQDVLGNVPGERFLMEVENIEDIPEFGMAWFGPDRMWLLITKLIVEKRQIELWPKSKFYIANIYKEDFLVNIILPRSITISNPLYKKVETYNALS